MVSGSVSACSTLWFDSGYMFVSVYGAMEKISHVFYVKVGLGEYRIMEFSGRSQERSLFNYPWFDSGYLFGVSLRGFLDEFHTLYV